MILIRFNLQESVCANEFELIEDLGSKFGIEERIELVRTESLN